MAVRTICVFCGSKTGRRPAYEAQVRTFGELLAARELTVVYGGGDIGLMGVLADAVLAAGGEVVGVIPEFMLSTELGHGGVTRLEVVGSMHDRKARMAELADAFVALPGGIGTLEELFEIWTWAQLGLHQKPIGLLNLEGFFDHAIALIQHTVYEGFVKERTRDLLLVDDDPVALLHRIAGAAEIEAAAPAAATAEGDGLART
jgi:uncharacterized protein (TIGR00730 family)